VTKEGSQNLRDDHKQHGSLTSSSATIHKREGRHLRVGLTAHGAIVREAGKARNHPAPVREFVTPQGKSSEVASRKSRNVQRADTTNWMTRRATQTCLSLQTQAAPSETIAAKVVPNRQLRERTIATAETDRRRKTGSVPESSNYSHAFESLHLQPKDQQHALQECFPQNRMPPAS